MSKEFICKGCGEKFNKDMQSNNVGYCYICNEFYMRKQIADLEAKLAESEKKIEELKGERLKFYTDNVRRTQVINGIHFDIEQLLVFSEYVEHENWVKNEKDKEIKQLKQQLAEKEKEYQSFKKIADENVNYLKNRILEETRNYNQDKISFALERLEEVKKWVIEYSDLKGQNWDNTLRFLNNQIKQLKEGK